MTGDHRSAVDPGETKRVSLTGERDTLIPGRICPDHSLLRYSVDALPRGVDDEFPLAPDRLQPEHYP
jgi:hypothetical protein